MSPARLLPSNLKAANGQSRRTARGQLATRVGLLKAREVILDFFDRKLATMQRTLSPWAVMAAVTLLSACAATLAPGADQVRITKNASDVVACKPLGNIQLQKNDQAFVTGRAQFRNLAVGLGANVALITEGLVSAPVAGIGYSCP